MECREVREYLPAYVDGERHRGVDEHLEACAACRGELEGYGELGAAMAALADRTPEPPAWLLESLRTSVRHRAGLAAARAERLRQLADPRVAAGGAVVAAAAVAGAMFLRGRGRRRRRVAGLRRLRHAVAGA